MPRPVTLDYELRVASGSIESGRATKLASGDTEKSDNTEKFGDTQKEKTAPSGTDSASVELTLYFHVQASVYEEWFQDDPRSLIELGEIAFEAKCLQVASFLESTAPVKIDGLVAYPRVTDLEFQDAFADNDFIDYVGISARYPCDGRPETVTLAWHEFSGALGLDLVRIPALVSCREDFQSFWFTETAHQETWRVPPAGTSFRDVAEFQLGDATRRPWLAIALWIAAAGIGGSAFLSHRFRVRVVVIAALFAGGGVYSWQQTMNTFPLTQPEAKRLFESLHRNVYRAFDENTEEGIYDALALSVSDGLLQELYREIISSLKIATEDSVQCTVRTVGILSIQLVGEPKAEAYQTECRWRVAGTVDHWGHKHWRNSEYSARFVVARVEEQWKIAAIAVLDQIRIEDGNQLDDTPRPQEF